MIKEKSLETIKDFSEMMKDIGKEWWFEYGTALGINRENDFIKDDTDIDIGVFADDKVQQMIGRIGRFAHSVSYWKVDGSDKKYRYIKFSKYDKFDILVYYKFDDYYSIRKKVYKDSFFCKQIPTGFLDEPKEVEFKGMKVKIPNHTDEYCKYIYGEGWRTPKNENNLKDGVILKINI